MRDEWRRGGPAAVTTSRAMNVSVAQADVETLCRKHGASISAIEPLPSGGTRVVLRDIRGADTMRKAFGKKVMAGNLAPVLRVRNG